MSFAVRIPLVYRVLLAGVLLLWTTSCGCLLSGPGTDENGIDARSNMTVLVTVRGEDGRPVKDAVIYAVQRERTPPMRKKAVVVLANKAFHPAVLPARLGTSLVFQNRDSVQHHIYSISAAKKIDIALTRGVSSAPIRLDKAGVIVLGCAIHDRMVGYVYTVDSEHFASTNANGTAELAGLPLRAVDLRVWHPLIKRSSEVITKRVVPSSRGRASIEFVISLQSRSGQR